MMENIRPIRNDEDLAWALAEIEVYFDCPPEKGTAAADRFDVLSDLIEAYENRHFVIDAPDPIEALKAFMEMTGRSQADLAELFGSRSRASEVLSRKRALAVQMIRKLTEEWGMPAELLLGKYELNAANVNARYPAGSFGNRA